MTIQDKTLIKLKDIVLIIGAVAGLVAGGTRLIAMPYQNERELIELRKIQDRANEEIAASARKINTLEAQYQEIMRSLSRIEKATTR